MEITIERMTSADIRDAAYVHWQSWLETYRGLVDDSYLRTLSWENSIKRFSDPPLAAWVARADGRIVGFTIYGSCRDADMPDAGEVYSLYVLKAYHGLRIGYRLLNQAITALPDNVPVILWVLEGNQRATAFYERYGFSPDGKRKTIPLPSGIDEFRMIYDRRKGEHVKS